MRVIRLLQAIHFDRRGRRFTSPAFQSSGKDGGISVVDEVCIRQLGHTVCEHVSKFYTSVAGSLIVFWSFDTDNLPFECTLEYVPSPTGDKCHVNIRNVRDKDAKRYFKTVATTDFYVCEGTAARHLTEEDFDRIARISDRYFFGQQG